jgi:hypothetical protein
MKSILNSSSWTIKKSKLAICIPCRDLLHSAHALSLLELVKFNTLNGIETQVFMNASTVLLTQREHLADQAIDYDAEYVLWLDSDITFPSTTAVKLLAHKKDFVACNYVRRTFPVKSVAYEKMYDWNNPLNFDIKDDLIKIEGIGMGCVLMKTEIFSKLSKPFFEFRYSEDSNDWLGEDMILCEKIRNLGIELFVDSILSNEIRHLGTYAFGPKMLD